MSERSPVDAELLDDPLRLRIAHVDREVPARRCVAEGLELLDELPAGEELVPEDRDQGVVEGPALDDVVVACRSCRPGSGSGWSRRGCRTSPTSSGSGHVEQRGDRGDVDGDHAVELLLGDLGPGPEQLLPRRRPVGRPGGVLDPGLAARVERCCPSPSSSTARGRRPWPAPSVPMSRNAALPVLDPDGGERQGRAAAVAQLGGVQDRDHVLHLALLRRAGPAARRGRAPPGRAGRSAARARPGRRPARRPRRHPRPVRRRRPGRGRRGRGGRAPSPPGRR